MSYKIKTFIVVLAACAAVAAAYRGCKTSEKCQRSGDEGAYCRPNGYCHCDQPFYNATSEGTCKLICCPTCAVKCCRDDRQCRLGGDTTGYCRRVDRGGNGFCHCSTGFGGQFCTRQDTSTGNVPAALVTKAVVTDCGTAADACHWSDMAVTPNPPVKGSLANITATGTCKAAVSAAKYDFQVKLDGATLYTHTGDGCGASTDDLPLGFGTIYINGLKCPLAAGAAGLGFGMKLPTAAPPGNYDLTFSGNDVSGSLWCLDIKFTFA